MAILAKREQADYRPAPEGLHQGVCVDVMDLGMKDTPFGKKHKVRFRWQLENRDPETGKRFSIQKDYTLSLHEQANLTKDLESWRGKRFTLEELNGFDLEVVIGANCQIQVVHNAGKEGQTWANVQTIVPINSKMTKIHPEEYVREKDRTNGQDSAHEEGAKYEATIDEVPF